MGFKSGFITIIGRPNVGKSTLLNRLAGEKIAIMSDKPQTTRNTIKTIVTKDDFQIIFIDTPGIHKPKNKLGEYMVNSAQNDLNEVDIVMYMVEAGDEQPGAGDLFIIDILKNIKTPIFLIVNKIDLVEKEKLLVQIANFSEHLDFKAVIPISATQNQGIDLIFEEAKKNLPEGPKYFPDDMVTDQPEKVIAAEMIREKAINLLKDEVPYGIGVEVISFKERKNSDIIDIKANIYCEKQTHKGIIIGKGGRVLKEIGTQSRKDIENLLGSKVYLELWVKVKADWRNDSNMLRELGYTARENS